MPHKPEYAQRLLRELNLPDDAERILESLSYADSAFAEAYYEYCEEVLFHSPEDAPRLAKVAVRLAQLLPEEEEPEVRQELRELFVRAYWIQGSAYRAVGRPAEADKSYEKALRIQPISDSVKAGLDLRLAVLRASQKRFDEALKLVDGAQETCGTEGDPKALGHVLSTRGFVYNEAGRFDKAVPELTKALAKINPHLDPESGRFHYSVTHNLGFAISRCTSPRAIGTAQVLLRQARKLIGNRRRSVPRYKLYWIEGQAFVRLGSTHLGERRYLYAFNGLLTLGAPFEAALVCLDLSKLLRDEGRWDELEQRAAETFLRFEALSADEEAIAALKLWREAVQAQKLEDVLVDEIKAKLSDRMLRHPPQGTIRQRRRRR